MQVFTIFGFSSWLCIDQTGNPDVLGNPGQQAVLAKATGELSQDFVFHGVEYANGRRAYQIVFLGSPNLVLDIPAFSKEKGTHAQMWEANGGTNQLWTFLPAGALTAISNVNSGLVLDDPAFSKTPGTPVQQWPLNSGENQQWGIGGKQDAGFTNKLQLVWDGNTADGVNAVPVAEPFSTGATGSFTASALLAGPFVEGGFSAGAVGRTQSMCFLEDPESFVSAYSFFGNSAFLSFATAP